MTDTFVHLAHTQHPQDAAPGRREDESEEDSDGDSAAVPAGYRLLGSSEDADAESEDEDGGARGREDSAPSSADDSAPASASTVQSAGDPPDAGGVAQPSGGIVPAFSSEAQVEGSCFSALDAAHIRMFMGGFDLPAPEWARELDVSTHACPAARPFTRQLH